MNPADTPAANAPDATLFAARITPHRSMGRQAFRITMTLVCLASVISSLPFVLMGAWPVAGFFGLDLAALYIAFRINFRRAESFEEVWLSRVELLLRKVSHRGIWREWRFNPLWTRLEQTAHVESGVERLAFVSRGERVTVGDALSPHEKASLGTALRDALNEAKR
ncbi:MAG: DUF2244 domain-containing protein [Pseudochelatococcus sp.]|jgi:uncharacterized membrane protein|uniref:DUF2244 domain-containing protein n=1 Tax=Pseudochelatococcus sp. TaxID=2020869 RepID=UPI003D923BC3